MAFMAFLIYQILAQASCHSNFSKTKIDENRNYNCFSGVLKAEGDFFGRFFKEQEFKITIFLGARPGIGRYVFNSGDDIFLSFSTEIGFKVKYKDFFVTIFSVNQKGFQEPSGRPDGP